MSNTYTKFSEAFSNYILAKNNLIKENVPHFIKVNPSYMNTFLNERQNSSGEFQFTFSSDGSYYIYVDFLNDTYEVPVVMDESVDTFENVFKTDK